MADREIYIGTVGPYLIDTTDPLASAPGQVATLFDIPGGVFPAAAVMEEKTFGLDAAVGVSDDYARADHTHGTPPDPEVGHTEDIVVVTGLGPPVVTATLHFINGRLDSVS